MTHVHSGVVAVVAVVDMLFRCAAYAESEVATRMINTRNCMFPKCMLSPVDAVICTVSHTNAGGGPYTHILHTYTHTCIQTHMHTSRYLHVHVCIPTYVHTHACIHVVDLAVATAVADVG